MTVNAKKLNKKNLDRSFLSRYWWVVLFFLLCYVTYDQAMKRKKREIFSLQTRIEQIEEQKAVICKQREELFLKIGSESDPEWIELVLMKQLGVVPSGFLKVHFQKDPCENF